MTDERLIEPRDGDIVRAKRGEYGVVEGVFHSYPISSGWGIGSEAEEDGLFAWNDKGWTITDILATPEPAPIEVGDWWATSDGTPVVIVRPDTEPDFMQVRQWDEGIVRRNPVEGIRQLWTRLDGPPEPPAGTIGVVGALVFQTTFNRGVAQMDGERSGSWETFLAQSYVQHRLATLQIVHTLEVE